MPSYLPTKAAFTDVLESHVIRKLLVTTNLSENIVASSGGLVVALPFPDELPSNYNGENWSNVVTEKGVDREQAVSMVQRIWSDDFANDWGMRGLLDLEEKDLPNHQLRVLHYESNYRSEKFHIAVRSDEERYVYIDQDVLALFLKYELDEPVKNFDGEDAEYDVAFYVVRPENLSFWIHDLLKGIPLMDAEQRALFDAELQGGFVLREVDSSRLQGILTADQNAELQEWISGQQEYRMGFERNMSFQRFAAGTSRRIRVGNWKVTRINEEWDKAGPEAKNVFEFDNTHGKLRATMATVTGAARYTNMDEATLISEFINSYRNKAAVIAESVANTALQINGVNVRAEVVKNRLKLMDSYVRASETVEVVQNFFCLATEAEMVALTKDVSEMSLERRKWLAEGSVLHVRMEETISVDADGHDIGDNALILAREENGSSFRHSTAARGTLARGGPGSRIARQVRATNYEARLKLTRAEKGMRLGVMVGKNFHVVKTSKYRRLVSHGSFDSCADTIAAFQKAFPSMTPRDVKRLLWKGIIGNLDAIRRSMELLSEVAKEVGATKRVIAVEGKSVPAYIVIGESGTEYAITDDPRHRSYRLDGKVWRFICIENSGDQTQEVAKDKLVTRLYALKNDTDHVGEISTLTHLRKSA